MEPEIQIGIIIILSLLLFLIYGRQQAAASALDRVEEELGNLRQNKSYEDGFIDGFKEGLEKGGQLGSQDGWSDEALEYRKMVMKIVEKYLPELELES